MIIVREFCGFYGGLFSFSSIPTTAWKASFALIGAGCIVMAISCFCCFLMHLLPKGYDRKMAIWSGHIQILAGM
jgi:hypothetical protein